MKRLSEITGRPNAGLISKEDPKTRKKVARKEKDMDNVTKVRHLQQQIFHKFMEQQDL